MTISIGVDKEAKLSYECINTMHSLGITLIEVEIFNPEY